MAAVSTRPGIIVRMPVKFPARVIATAPLIVTKIGAEYTFSVDPIVGKTLSVQSGGNTNNSNSGSGSDFDHSLTYSIPADFMTAGRVFRVSVHYQMTTGSSPPLLTHKLKLGSVILLSSGGITPGPNLANAQTGIQFMFQATSAPSASANVQCMAIESLNSFGVTGVGVTPMPVVVPTDIAQTLKIATQWSGVGTGINTIGLNQLIVETLN